MSRRWNSKTRARKYDFLVQRDGERCFICHRGPPELKLRLQIDHINGHADDSRSGNLRLLCSDCNHHEATLRASNLRQKGNPPRLSRGLHSDLKEREKIPVQPQIQNGNRAATERVRALVDFGAGSAEMAANELYEVPFREWVLAQLGEGRTLGKREAIFEGAEVVGCSPTTARNYLEKLVSKAGPAEEGRGDGGQKVIRLRQHRGEEAL